MPLFVTGPDRPLMDGPEYGRFLLVPLSFMIVFYTNFFRLIDRYLTTRRFTLFTTYNLLLILLVMVSIHLLFRHVLPPGQGHHPPMDRPWQDAARFFLGNATLYLLVVGISVAIRMTGGWYRAEAARKELEHSRTEAELQNLKSQLNPHFLFNTLNNIYSLIQLDTVRAQQAVHDLSRMLRYVLYDSCRATVPLASEIEFLRDYIELMRIRLPRHVRVFVSLPDTPSSTRIAPLLFISLVENAFKHGVSYEKPSYITIDIHEMEDQLLCSIKNSSFPKSDSDRSGSGIGLQNLSKRLEMIYPGRYIFEYGPAGECRPQSIFVKTEYRLQQIELDRIDYIEGLKDYVKIHVDNEPHPVLSLMSLKSLEEQLPADRFVRIHRSYIIQPSKMQAIERNRVVFGKEYLPISDNYRQPFYEFLAAHSLLF